MAASRKAHARNSPTTDAKWRLLEETVNDLRAAFADMTADELHALLDEAVASVRRDRRRKHKGLRRK